MQTVSQFISGQSLFSVALRSTVCAACVIVSFTVLAKEGSSTPDVTTNSSLSTIVEDDSAAIAERAGQKRESREADAQIERPGRGGLDRKGLKRALADGGNTSAGEGRRSMSAEERRALKRELRDAMRGANSSSARITPAASGPTGR